MTMAIGIGEGCLSPQLDSVMRVVVTGGLVIGESLLAAPWHLPEDAIGAVTCSHTRYTHKSGHNIKVSNHNKFPNNGSSSSSSSSGNNYCHSMGGKCPTQSSVILRCKITHWHWQHWPPAKEPLLRGAGWHRRNR